MLVADPDQVLYRTKVDKVSVSIESCTFLLKPLESFFNLLLNYNFILKKFSVFLFSYAIVELLLGLFESPP